MDQEDWAAVLDLTDITSRWEELRDSFGVPGSDAQAILVAAVLDLQERSDEEGPKEHYEREDQVDDGYEEDYEKDFINDLEACHPLTSSFQGARKHYHDFQDAIKLYPVSTNIEEVRSFLGIVAMMEEWTPVLQKDTVLMEEVLKKGAVFRWTPGMNLESSLWILADSTGLDTC